jgi:hypothetical protein
VSRCPLSNFDANTSQALVFTNSHISVSLLTSVTSRLKQFILLQLQYDIQKINMYLPVKWSCGGAVGKATDFSMDDRNLGSSSGRV